MASGDERLPAVFKLIREAQTLDGNGDELGAYRHYLSCVQFMCEMFSTDIHANQGQGTLRTQQVAKMFSMARMCLARAEEMFETAQKEKRPFALFPRGPSPLSPSPAAASTATATHPSSSHYPPPFPSSSSSSLQPPRPPRPAGPGLQRNTLPPSSFPASSANHAVTTRAATISHSPQPHRPTRMSGAPPPPSRTQSWSGSSEGLATLSSGAGLVKRGVSAPMNLAQPISPLHRLSPMDEAQLRNRHMMQQYQAHLRRSTSDMLPRSYHDAGLSMLRRLEENVGVARIREQSMARKLRERELRLQQETATAAADKSKGSHVPLKSMTVEEICCEISNFEHSKPSLGSLRSKLYAAVNDHGSLYNLVNEILSVTDHPLSKLLGECQYTVYMMLQPVGSAVEKAGGLPELKIELDKNQTGRNTSAEDEEEEEEEEGDHTYDVPRPHPPSNEAGSKVEQSDDNRLDLLCGDEDDDDIFDFSIGRTNEGGQPASNGTNRPDGHKMADTSNAHRGSSSSYSSSPSSSSELLGNQGSDDAIQTSRYKNFPNKPLKKNSGSNSVCMELDDMNFDPNPCYQSSLKRSDVSPPKGQTGSIYEDPDAVLDQLEALKSSEHTYETMESMFPAGSSGRLGRNLPDGGLISFPITEQPEEEEEEEEEGGGGEGVKGEEGAVEFRNLPLLMCSAHLGDQHSLVKLADTADTVLKEVVKIIHSSLELLESVLVGSYPCLSPEPCRCVCQTVLEAGFFPPILQPLVIVYRCKSYTQEVALAKNMCQHVNATPRDLVVRNKFWLTEQSHAPYGEAIEELLKVSSYQCPSPKLEALVRMSKRLVQCIEDYYSDLGRNTVNIGVGVDDILPILSYIIIRSGMPQLVSECAIMEEFIQEGYMMGEEGFCLTSFRTALQFLTNMSS